MRIPNEADMFAADNWVPQVPDIGLPARPEPAVMFLDDLSTMDARRLLWFARLNLGTLVNLAWTEY